MKRVLALALLTALVASLSAQTQKPRDAAPKGTTKQASGRSVSQQVVELKQAVEALQQQLSALGRQVESRDQRIQQLEQKLDQSQSAATQAQAKADSAASQTTEQAQTVTALNTTVTTLNTKVTDLESNSTNIALSLQETQKNVRDQIQSPLAIHFKGVTLTPGGFLAAESVYRTRALSADINTPFNSVNMPGAGQNSVSEFYGSARQSRISLLAEGGAKDFKMSGYYEADFLSAGITSNNNQSNSYTLRQRQLWGQVASGGWSFTGGQMWSLIAETRHGMDNRSEALPMTIDPQYTIGFSWARQYGVRVVKNFGNRFWVGASLENPQTTFAARGNAANFALGGPGSGGGLYNSGITNCATTTITGTGGTITSVSTSCTPAATYSFNATPDFIVKLAAEPGFGHYEVFGIFSRFRDRVYPCGEPGAASNCNGAISALGSFNDSVNGGGVGANARITLFKQLDLGAHALAGQGVGRYGTGGLPDATVHANGTLAPLRSYQGLGTLEWHTKRIDIYSNFGLEYVQRHWQTDPNNPTDPLTPVGYGSQLFNVAGCYTETPPPLTGTNGFTFGSLSRCSADTKSLVEGTIGFWIKAHVGQYGRLQFGPQYSYVSRYAWTGTSGILFAAPHGIDNMFFTSFRYYLP
jgi:chaperonin cofactor prefoldin